MGDVPEGLESLVANLPLVKKKNFETILRASILDIEGAPDEIDEDAVGAALAESGIEDQQEFSVIFQHSQSLSEPWD